MKHGICDICRKIVHVGLDGKMVMQRLTYWERGKMIPPEMVVPCIVIETAGRGSYVPIHFGCIPGTIYDARRQDFRSADADSL